MKRFILIMFLGVTEVCLAQEKECYSNLNEVLSCFIQYQDNVFSYSKEAEVNKEDVKVETYILESQKWPINEDPDVGTTIWKHKLNIYIPQTVEYKTALLYVGGGYTATKEGVFKFTASKEYLDYIKLATDNNAVVIELQDVPNQALKMKNKYIKEDAILAFTYNKVMEDPMKNAYLAGHLPMVKSVVKAMDAVQEILVKQKIYIEDFMLVGASKRGWAVWLTSIEDKRVSATIPIVIDILNVQKNINHICNSYKDGCPPALRDYKAENITLKINTEAFVQLMQIEDPFSYKDLPKYAKQFSIPKFIINASGDDFYAADSSSYYFKDLPGEENYIKFLAPHARHYFAGDSISERMGSVKKINEAIDNFFYYQLHNIKLPKVSWSFKDDKIMVNTSLKPYSMKLWSAVNEKERDFRCFAFSDSLIGYGMYLTYNGLAWLENLLSIPVYGSICDTAFKENYIENKCSENSNCLIEVKTPEVKAGWRASFIELKYKVDNRDFVITTEMLVRPN